MPDLKTLRREAKAWNRRMNRDRVKINWKFDRQAARLGNVLRRLRNGLPARGGPVSPEVADDLFVAHLALYDFAARFAAARNRRS